LVPSPIKYPHSEFLGLGLAYGSVLPTGSVGTKVLQHEVRVLRQHIRSETNAWRSLLRCAPRGVLRWRAAHGQNGTFANSRPRQRL